MGHATPLDTLTNPNEVTRLKERETSCLKQGVRAPCTLYTTSLKVRLPIIGTNCPFAALPGFVGFRRQTCRAKCTRECVLLTLNCRHVWYRSGYGFQLGRLRAGSGDDITC